jgi:RHS repeat-associated protein
LASIYAYSGSLLTSVKNHDGYELAIGYSTSLPKRVISLTEKNGATLGTTLSMTYGDNFTTFTDFSNRSLQLQFTDWGHTVAKVNDLGYAQYYKFFNGDGGAVANKLNSVSKLQQSITNALVNSGGESGDTGWSDFPGSGSSATVDITTADKFLGNYSLRVIKTNTTSFSQHSQTLALTKGQTYTLSSRIKTVSVSSANQGGAWLEASYKNNSGTYVAVNSSPLSGSQDWMKQSVSFTIPSDATDGTVLIRLGIKNETGTAYFDNVQVEEGDVANRYNLLSNSGFTGGLTGWTHSGGSIVSLTGRLNVSTQALQIVGSASLDRTVSQDVNLGGSSGDVYTFGGWAKADSVPTNTTKIFDVTVEFYNGTTLVNRVSADFNPSFKNWQYVSGAAIASGTYTKVRLLARYHKNLNTVAFDDLALFKETFSTSYQYDANGNVISTQQLSNETNGMQYNANDDLVKVTDEIGGQFLYTYDSKHNLLSALSASNVNYTMSYDAYGNNTSLTTKTNLIAYYSFDGNNLYDSSGNNYHGTNYGATFATGRFGNAIVFNGTSQWAQLTDFPVGDNFSISMWVKPHSTLDGQLILGKHDSSGNNIWLYGYWENGIHTRIRSLTTTGGTKYSNEYKHHVLTFEKMSDTSTKVSVYINGGNPIYQTTLNQPIQPTAGKPWVLGQDWDGSVISDYFDGEIDDLAFFSGIIKPDQIKTTVSGALDIAAYKTFVSTSATTEANGQYTDKVTDALGNVTDTNWDATKGLLTSSIDAKNVTTTYTYHTNNDKLTSVSSGNASVSYGYTGDQLSTITRNGFSYGFTFDSLGNPTSVKMGTTPLITHSYQARTSLLLSSEYANGGKVSYDYDSLDRVIGVKIGSATSPQFEYRYDASGNLAIVKDNLRNITTYLEYDLANRLSKVTDSQGHAITYGFDAKNRLSGVSEVLKGTTYTSNYTYNADNQPATVSADGKTHSYTYDLLGRLSGTSLNTTTPYTTALTYKSNPSTGSSSHVLNSYRSGSTTTTYQVDANGNITQLSDGTHTYTYVYDDFNQLKRENNPLLNKSITYQYDLGGNLLAVNEYAYTTGTLGSPTSTVVYTYGSAWKDQLTKIGNDVLTYDTNGNLLSYKTRSYSWQAGRQLAQITDTNLNAVYTYNESGIRTRKEVNEVITDYVLEGGKVILETTGSDELHYSYDSRGQLVSFSLNGTPYFYTRNGQGDITGLIDASGVEVVRYTYDSWGKPISITGSLALTVGTMNPYRYRGYRYDTESGLYYLQSRYYDPSIKRFISADIFVSTGQGFSGNNMFAYCGNNPVNRSDSGGMFWEKIYHFVKFMIELPMIIQDNKINRRIHSENMINLGIDSDATPKTFVGKYVKQDEGYEERCRSKYKTFISLQSNQDIIDKRWEEITLERQNLIIAQMITWDRDAHYKAFFINYSLHLIKLGYDVIY